MIKTIKLPIYLSKKDKKIILKYQKNQNNVIRFTYNRLVEFGALSTKEVTVLQKTMNNVFVDSHFLNSAGYKAKEIYSTQKETRETVVFGGKKLFIKRCQKKISAEAFRLERLLPLISIGEANYKANRKFLLQENNTILFKPEKSCHLTLGLPKLRNNIKKELKLLLELQNLKQIPITYQLSMDYVWISFDDKILHTELNYKPVESRFMAIDMNPNYIGFVITQYENEVSTILKSGVFDLSKISAIPEKRNFETTHVAIELVKIFKANHCKVFGIENLNMKTKDHKKGKKFNKLVNNGWARNCLVNQIKKRIDRIKGTKFLEISPEYSSFVGNMLYRDTTYPDMVLSAIEINRRSYEFYTQYVIKSRPIIKNIIFPIWENILDPLAISLEEFGFRIDDFSGWLDLYTYCKNSKLKYRVPLDAKASRVFSLNSTKSKVFYYAL